MPKNITFEQAVTRLEEIAEDVYKRQCKDSPRNDNIFYVRRKTPLLSVIKGIYALQRDCAAAVL